MGILWEAETYRGIKGPVWGGDTWGIFTDLYIKQPDTPILLHRGTLFIHQPGRGTSLCIKLPSSIAIGPGKEEGMVRKNVLLSILYVPLALLSSKFLKSVLNMKIMVLIPTTDIEQLLNIL